MNRSHLARIHVPLVFLVAAVPSALFCGSARAALGRQADPTETVLRVVSGNASKTETHGSYSIREIRGQGFAFKEYVAKDGVVFGMTWTEKIPLGLDGIFGSYLSDYQQAAEQARAQKKPGRQRIRVAHLRVQGSQVTFERFGQGPSTHTRAIVSRLVPAGVNADEIK